MGSVNDVGVPGAPLSTPPLTEWQKAVRDALNGSDTPMDARIAAAINLQMGYCSPAAGWKDFGGAYAGMQVTRQNRIVTIGAMFSVTSNLAVAASSNYTMAYVPAWAFPDARSVIASAVWAWTSGISPQFTRVTVDTAGAIILVPPSAQTITASTGWVAVTCSYRCIP